ncbi:MAG: uroporphyrinogen-III synthase [Anaerolineales bacterium]|nr:uroporphyrinogen-III synthase [Anaerolineales bacterium]
MTVPDQNAPLAGKGVVVTQAVHQAPALAALLASAGAKPLLYPCIAIEPAPDTAPLDAALHDAAGGRFDWLVVTSANTVLVLEQRLAELEIAPGQLSSLSIAAIGEASAAAVRNHLQLPVTLTASDSVAEGLADELLPVLQPGSRVLLPQADIARPVLQDAVRTAGHQVSAIGAYRTVIGHGGVDLPRLLCAGEVDAVTFTSGSTVRNLRHRLTEAGGNPNQLNDLVVACIGPITAQSARDNGLHVDVVAQTHSLESLVEALAGYWKARS